MEADSGWSSDDACAVLALVAALVEDHTGRCCAGIGILLALIRFGSPIPTMAWRELCTDCAQDEYVTHNTVRTPHKQEYAIHSARLDLVSLPIISCLAVNWSQTVHTKQRHLAPNPQKMKHHLPNSCLTRGRNKSHRRTESPAFCPLTFYDARQQVDSQPCDTSRYFLRH